MDRSNEDEFPAVPAETLSNESKATRYVILIGLNYDNESNASSLHGAEDRDKIKALLMGEVNDRLSIKFKEENIKLFGTRVATPATRANLIAELRRLAEVCKEYDHVFFYYSGHGSRDVYQNFGLGTSNEELGLQASDTDEALALENGEYIFDAEMRQLLDRIPARKDLVFDSCFAGGQIRNLDSLTTEHLEQRTIVKKVKILRPATTTSTASVEGPQQKMAKLVSEFDGIRSSSGGKEILFAASSPLTTSLEINGEGLFTKHFIRSVMRNLETSPVSWGIIMEDVKADVGRESNNKQIPLMDGPANFQAFGLTNDVKNRPITRGSVIYKVAGEQALYAQLADCGTLHDIRVGDAFIVEFLHQSMRNQKFTAQVASTTSLFNCVIKIPFGSKPIPAGIFDALKVASTVPQPLRDLSRNRDYLLFATPLRLNKGTVRIQLPKAGATDAIQKVATELTAYLQETAALRRTRLVESGGEPTYTLSLYEDDDGYVNLHTYAGNDDSRMEPKLCGRVGDVQLIGNSIDQVIDVNSLISTLRSLSTRPGNSSIAQKLSKLKVEAAVFQPSATDPMQPSLNEHDVSRPTWTMGEHAATLRVESGCFFQIEVQNPLEAGIQEDLFLTLIHVTSDDGVIQELPLYGSRLNKMSDRLENRFYPFQENEKQCIEVVLDMDYRYVSASDLTLDQDLFLLITNKPVDFMWLEMSGRREIGSGFDRARDAEMMRHKRGSRRMVPSPDQLREFACILNIHMVCFPSKRRVHSSEDEFRLNASMLKLTPTGYLRAQELSKDAQEARRQGDQRELGRQFDRLTEMWQLEQPPHVGEKFLGDIFNYFMDHGSTYQLHYQPFTQETTTLCDFDLEQKQKVLIFIHGFFGNHRSTWAMPATEDEEDKDKLGFWPTSYDGLPNALKKVADSTTGRGLPPMRLYTLEHRGASSQASLDVLGSESWTKIKETLEKDKVLGNDIVFVGHSLGGLVAKKIWLCMENDQLRQQVKGFVFYATPHQGSGWASAHYFTTWFTPSYRATSQSLRPNEPDRHRMNEEFAGAFSSQVKKPAILVLREDTLAGACIVNKNSATQVFPPIGDFNHFNNPPYVTALLVKGSNHVTVCKISDSNPDDIRVSALAGFLNALW